MPLIKLFHCLFPAGFKDQPVCLNSFLLFHFPLCSEKSSGRLLCRWGWDAVVPSKWTQVLSSRGRALAKFLRHWLRELLSVDGFAGQSQFALTKRELMPAHPGTAVGMAPSPCHSPSADGLGSLAVAGLCCHSDWCSQLKILTAALCVWLQVLLSFNFIILLPLLSPLAEFRGYLKRVWRNVGCSGWLSCSLSSLPSILQNDISKSRSSWSLLWPH